MECPNDDPTFTRMMYRMGILKRDMKQSEIVNIRRNLFYFVCIIVRFALIVIVYKFRNVGIVRGFVLLGAMFAVVNLWNRNNGTQWWSKKFQLIMAVIIALMVILSYFGQVKTWTIPAAMLVSLLGGIFQSFYVGFC